MDLTTSKKSTAKEKLDPTEDRMPRAKCAETHGLTKMGSELCGKKTWYLLSQRALPLAVSNPHLLFSF